MSKPKLKSQRSNLTTSPMLHTKSQGHWPFVPENKIFKGFLPYKGVVALTFGTYL